MARAHVPAFAVHRLGGGRLWGRTPPEMKITHPTGQWNLLGITAVSCGDSEGGVLQLLLRLASASLVTLVAL